MNFQSTYLRLKLLVIVVVDFYASNQYEFNTKVHNFVIYFIVLYDLLRNNPVSEIGDYCHILVAQDCVFIR